MDPIQPIERRSPWASELAVAQAQSVAGKRRKKQRSADGKAGPRRPGPQGDASPTEPSEPGALDRSARGERDAEDGPVGRRIDVRA